MKTIEFAYLTDGEVTGLNRRGTEDGELTGNCTPGNLIRGMVSRYYTAPEGTIIPMSKDKIDKVKKEGLKGIAFDARVEALKAKTQSENEKPFPYNRYTYSSSPSARRDIEGVFGQCAYIIGADPIPTFKKTADRYGKWMTLEHTYVAFTCDGFIVFSQAYFNRFSWNFDNMVLHAENLAAIYLDSNKDSQDIEDYDFSSGWE